MVSSVYALFLGAASLAAALPVNEKRTVTSLDQAAFEEAQQRDDTATRAFSSVPIKTSDGKCLLVDELSGDFRANLTPIQVADCDGSAGQSWDVITAGKHDNQPGTMLIVSTLTQACFNFDPRRAAGNQVLLFSCGGRADGSGQVTDSQLFPFSGGAGPLALTPKNAAGTCLTVKGAVIDQAACNTADPNQSFTFGGAASGGSPPAPPTSGTASSTAAPPPPPSDPIGAATVTVTVTTGADVSCDAPTGAVSPPSNVISTPEADTTSVAVVTTPPPATTAAAATSIVSVSRAGGVLNPSAAAEANPRDDTATRAFSSVALKSASGMCLFIDASAGDFRENLIPIVLQPCNDSPGEKWDIITAGKHNDQSNAALIVSTLTQGCLNFDSRRAAGDTVIMFSCGGRADGGGAVTDSQLFAFTAGETSLRLQPQNGQGNVCLVANASGRLDQAACSDDPAQVFTIG